MKIYMVSLFHRATINSRVRDWLLLSGFQAGVTLILTLDRVRYTAYRCASVIDLYLHTKFHWNRKKTLLWTDVPTDEHFKPSLILLGRLGEVDIKRYTKKPQHVTSYVFIKTTPTLSQRHIQIQIQIFIDTLAAWKPNNSIWAKMFKSDKHTINLAVRIQIEIQIFIYLFYYF